MALRLELIEMLSNMDDGRLDRLRDAVTHLLSQGIIYKGAVISQNHHYRTLLNDKEAAQTLLRLLRLNLHLDTLNGYVRLLDPEREFASQFSKDESVVLVILRILLQERNSQASWEKDTIVTVGDIREAYLLHAGKNARVFPMVTLGNILRRFAKLKLIGLDRGFEVHDLSDLKLLPTIYSVIPPESIGKAYELLSKYVGENGGAAPSSADSGPETAEPVEEPVGEEEGL